MAFIHFNQIKMGAPSSTITLSALAQSTVEDQFRPMGSGRTLDSLPLQWDTQPIHRAACVTTFAEIKKRHDHQRPRPAAAIHDQRWLDDSQYFGFDECARAQPIPRRSKPSHRRLHPTPLPQGKRRVLLHHRRNRSDGDRRRRMPRFTRRCDPDSSRSLAPNHRHQRPTPALLLRTSVFA